MEKRQGQIPYNISIIMKKNEEKQTSLETTKAYCKDILTEQIETMALQNERTAHSVKKNS